MQDPAQKLAHEHMFLDKLAAQNLDPRTYSRWLNGRSSHRFMAHKGKRIIAFRVNNNIPVTIDTLECLAVHVSFESGFTTAWSSRALPGVTLQIGQTPTEVADSCFMFHTVLTGTEYVEYAHEKYGLLVSVTYRTPSNPYKSLRQGPVFLLEEPAFHRLFPISE